MKCVVPGLNVKVLARAIHALCRIGDELYVEPEPSKLILRAVSATKASYASFAFYENFFSYYCFEQANSQDQDVTCKVSMKSCLSVFRSPTHMDKKVESCEIKLEPGGVKLIFEFHCLHGMMKTHYLPIIECETLEAVYSKDMVPNRLVVQPKIFTFSLSNFQLNTREITLVVTPQRMLLRNYAEDDIEMQKAVRTELCLEPGEFDHYSIGVDTSITFGVKDFRALLQFAEGVSLPITANFETGGRPIVFIVKNNPTFETNFVFATLMSTSNNNLNSSQQSSETVYQNNRPGKRTISKTNIEATSSKKSRAKEQENNTSSRPTTSNQNSSIPGPSRDSGSFQEQCIIDSNSDLVPRLCIQERNNDSQLNTENNSDEDTVPGTPPPVNNARYIFKRCFQRTFNSQMLPGFDEVLAEDSDEETRT